jgi:hypothetical protein
VENRAGFLRSMNEVIDCMQIFLSKDAGATTV